MNLREILCKILRMCYCYRTTILGYFNLYCTTRNVKACNITYYHEASYILTKPFGNIDCLYR